MLCQITGHFHDGCGGIGAQVRSGGPSSSSEKRPQVTRSLGVGQHSKTKGLTRYRQVPLVVSGNLKE